MRHPLVAKACGRLLRPVQLCSTFSDASCRVLLGSQAEEDPIVLEMPQGPVGTASAPPGQVSVQVPCPLRFACLRPLFKSFSSTVLGRSGGSWVSFQSRFPRSCPFLRLGSTSLQCGSRRGVLMVGRCERSVEYRRLHQFPETTTLLVCIND